MAHITAITRLALPLFMIAGAAQADLTAPELWQEMIALQEAQGVQLRALSQSYENGVLTLSGVTTQQRTSEGSMIGNLDRMTLTEDERGVQISLSPSYVLTSSAEVGSDTIIVPVTFGLQGFNGHVTDTDPRQYAFDMEALTFDMDADFGEGPIKINMRTGPYTADSTISAGTDKPFDFVSNAKISSVALSAFFETDHGAELSMTGLFNDILSDSVGQFGAQDAQIGSGIAGLGIDLGGVLNFANGTLDVTTFTPAQNSKPATLNATYGPGSYTFDMTADALGFGFTGKQSTMNLSSEAFGPTLELAVALSESKITFPLGAHDTPQPVALLLSFKGAQLGDTLWDMMDPMGQLPRDPMNLTLDVEGSITPKIDLRAAADAETFDPQDLELNTVTLNELRLDVAGTSLTGNGALTFDNSTSDMPRPIGKLAFELMGGFTLADRLVAMGLLPAQQAQMGKMMSGLLAKPIGEDALASELEFTASGSMLVNGLPLPF